MGKTPTEVEEAMTDPARNTASFKVRDRLFVDQLRAAEDIKAFLIRENIVSDTKTIDDYYSLAAISSYRHSLVGRPVQPDEWKQLDGISIALVKQLKVAGPDKNHDFLLWKCRRYFGLPAKIFAVALLMAFFTFSLTQLIRNQFGVSPDAASWIMVAFKSFEIASSLIWTVALGGLGVAAFFATSLLTTQNSRTEGGAPVPVSPPGGTATPGGAPPPIPTRAERLNDENYLRNRLTTGLIFAFILGVCFSRDSIELVYAYVSGANHATADKVNETVTNTFIIVTPFLFGFSTDIALGVLDRGVSTVSTLFGIGQAR